jgi:HPt (histidine-containing phosphotransfer) domain-containing protein
MAEAAGRQALPAIHGIDTQAGLATCMDSVDLYRRLLNSFRSGQEAFASMFAAARNGNDASAPARLAHTLKGTAGNIGARGVQAAAGELESACLANASASTLDALLAGVMRELEPVIAALEVNTENADVAPVTSIDMTELDTQSARLKALLGDSDAEAADLWDEYANVFKVAYPQHWREIETGLSNFDFEIALTALEAAEQERSV